MPNAALATGFNALLASNGEALIFRSATITGIVNRETIRTDADAPDFDPRDMSEVRINTADVSSIPIVGEKFTDEYSLTHRIQTVRRIGGFYTCKCEVAATS